MSIKEHIYIKDSCILFDLIDLDLVECFYNLDIQVVTTRQVIAEITDLNQIKAINHLISKEAICIDDQGEYEMILSIFQANAGLSFADCSVIEVALRRGGIILTSDNNLRKKAIGKQVNVKGMLWIINELIQKDILPIGDAISKLALYPKINNRAPKKEIAILISKLTDEATVKVNS